MVQQVVELRNIVSRLLLFMIDLDQSGVILRNSSQQPFLTFCGRAEGIQESVFT